MIECGCRDGKTQTIECSVIGLNYTKTSIEFSVPVGELKHRELVTIVTLLVVFLCLSMIIYTTITLDLSKNKKKVE